MRDSYWSGLGLGPRTPPPPPPAATPRNSGSTSNSSGSGLSAGSWAGIVVGIVAGSALLLLAAFLYIRRAGHRFHFGRGAAPKAGPNTTLLVTDVENSTGGV